MAAGPDQARTVRVLRIISRLNIGGPAIQAITLTKLLEPLGYDTKLVRGREDPEEGSMDHLAAELGVQPLEVASLRRNPGFDDFRALAALVRLLRRERPHIVHTHAAKAGTLGRLAALIACRSDRPALVHTFHGHSLRGYFSSRKTSLYLRMERFLARRTARLIAVSDEVRDELVALGVSSAEKFEVVRLGFDLSPFLVDETTRAHQRAAFRSELGIPGDTKLVTLVARLVPIKRVDRFLRVAAMLQDRADTHFLIVGDGELRGELRASAEARSLEGRLTWAGFRRDIPTVCFASDVVVLTSDNEGTPVSLIEAQTAGVPVVSTAVGGVASVVDDGETGLLTPPDDDVALARALGEILAGGKAARAMGARGRERMTSAHSLARLVADIDLLYRHLLRPDAGRSSG